MEATAAASTAVFVIAYLIVMGSILLITNAFVIVSYILDGISYSTIARRRGIDKPWLAWVPVAKFWLLGAISDQYQYVVKGKLCNRRKVLLGFNIATVSGALILTVCMLVWMFSMGFFAYEYGESSVMPGYFGGMAVIYLMSFLLSGLGIVQSVFQYLALYDLFQSSDPDKSLVYLLLSIFIGFPLPFFVFACRNKDLGMPPRKEPEPLPEAQ